MSQTVNQKDNWDMNMPLLWFSQKDAWTLNDATKGLQIWGQTGSGKSSASGKAIAKAFLKAQCGGLVLCGKVGEAEQWLQYAHETGRENSIIHVKEEGDFRFDFLDYEMTREGGGDPENILDLFIKVIELAQKSDMSGGENAYFYDECKALLRTVIFICTEAFGRVSLVDVYNIISSAPTSIEEAQSEEWQQSSECFAALQQCNQNEKEKQQQLGEHYPGNHELDMSARYLLRSFPRYGDRLRSSITSIFTSAADPWLRGKLRQLFCRKRDEINPLTGETGFYLDPDHCKDGAIYLFDYPVKSGLTGRLSQSLYKLVWQQHFERRNLEKDGGRPVFLFVDEAQLFLDPQDQAFAQTARSSRVLTVLLSQNQSNYHEALGRGNGERGKQLTKSLLGNLATTILHANDEDMAEYGSKKFGTQWQFRPSMTKGESAGTSMSHGEQGNAGSNDGTSSSLTYNEQERRVIEPREFGLLRTGGEENNYVVDALVHQAGRVWNATSSNYLFVEFDQRDV